MRATGTVVVLSLACAGAIWLLASGWSQPRPSLDRTIGHLRRRGPVPVRDEQPILARIGAAVVGAGSGARTSPLAWRAARWQQPLRLVDRSVATHVGLLVVVAAGGLVIPALAVMTLQRSGLVSSGAWVPAGISLVGAVVAPMTLHAATMSTSGDRRIDVRHQLSAYLDLVAMLLAGNTGHEGALDAAARGGDGMLFRELRRRMREMGTMGRSLVGALALVGEDLGVVELEHVAATAALSAAEGAPVARTLASKCATLRSSLAAEQETAARIRTDKVTPPLVGMAVLFMALIIYPALDLN